MRTTPGRLAQGLTLAVVLAIGSTVSLRGDILTTDEVLYVGDQLYSGNLAYELKNRCGTDNPQVCSVIFNVIGVCGGPYHVWSTQWDGDCPGLGSHKDQVGYGDTGQYLIMQADGNLVLYKGNNTPIWDTGTAGYGSSTYLNVQDDGNLVLYYGADVAIWSVF